ncbi:MAG: hypothetical protein JSU81_02425 [Candidatus Coatesbacteria bacterium]|nr:MAG: hypothetical protein JSU81_02425 [Candidatus Coatesbacteria bacterium]
MKILYGAQGTGNGHIMRTKAIVPLLREAGVEVELIVSGTTSEGFKAGVPELEPYRAFHGFSYIRHEGRISIGKSLEIFKPIELAEDFAEIRGEYDLVISDFEPLTAWWGLSHEVPVIGIAHNYAFQGKAPRPLMIDPLIEVVFHYYAPADVPLGSHWQRTNETVIPPIIRNVILEAEPEEGDHVLIYLPSFSDETLDRTFGHRDLASYRFVAYPRRSDREIEAANLTIKPFSREGFVEDLCTARAVITSAGFTLLSECLHLGKPLYVIPEAGQYEQKCNAEALKKWNLGAVAHEVVPGEVAAWLEARRMVRKRWPDVAAAFAAWVAAGRPESPLDFSARLWEEVHRLAAKTK